MELPEAETGSVVSQTTSVAAEEQDELSKRLAALRQSSQVALEVKEGEFKIEENVLKRGDDCKEVHRDGPFDATNLNGSSSMWIQFQDSIPFSYPVYRLQDSAN